MKAKISLLTVFLAVLIAFSTAHATQTLYKLGNSPFFTPPLTSTTDLEVLVETAEEDIKAGFALAGQPELYTPFMEQFPNADVKQIEVQKGEKLAWMLYKKNGKGKVRITKDVTWGADKPFSAFEFYIDYEDNRYIMVVPFACGNLALREVVKAPVVAAAAPQNLPPNTVAFVLPEEGNCNTPVTVDARKSSDPDGTVETVNLVVETADGKKVVETAMTAPFTTEFPMPCGVSTVKVTAVDNMGLQGNTVEKTIKGISPTRFVADAAFMRQFDPANYILARVGVEHYFNENFSILGLIGGAPKIRGDDGENAFVIDALAKYTTDSSFFMAMGLGGWITSGDSDNDLEDSQLDVIAEIGFRVFGEKDAFNTSLFLEARSGIDELGDMAKYGRFGVGLRFQF